MHRLLAALASAAFLLRPSAADTADRFGAFGTSEPRPDGYALVLDPWRESCKLDCAVDSATRQAGPGRPGDLADVPYTLPATRQHPWYPTVVGAAAPHPEYCEQGCAYLFTTSPSLGACRARCDAAHAFRDTTGYNDRAELARLACRDGCAVGIARCTHGYYCSEDRVRKCPPGRFRTHDMNNTLECVHCPAGRWRDKPEGKYMESCTKCPAGRYVNYTGSDEVEDCERCPAGRFSNEPGMGECRCISRWSCGGAEPFVATAGYRACNAAAENCDSGAFPVKLRKMAEWYVCNAGPNRDKVLEAHGTTMAQQRDGMCEEYVLRDNGATGAPWDHSYNTQELVTGEEVRGKDGRPANWF